MKLSSFTVIVSFIALSLVGVALLPLLPVKLAPSRALPSLTVQFSMPGSSARVVESEVTSRIESMLARVQGVKEITSSSSDGSGTITLGLDKHADVEMARFEVSTIVRQAWSQLPEGVTYPHITTRQSDSNGSRPFLSYTLNAPATPFEIQRFAEETMKPAIGRLPGVSKVEISGAMPMEWRLEYDSDHLAAAGLTPTDIVEAISEHFGRSYIGKAHMADGWMRLSVTAAADQEHFSPREIVLHTPAGTAVTLDRLVKATYAEAEPTSYYRINGLNSIYFNITADADANQLQLASQVKEQMASLRRLMPAGFQSTLSYDATDSISEELDKIYFRSGLTFLILLAFVGLITLNLRYMLVITISLVINLAIAVIFYYLLRVEIQLYSLAGITISLNLIIDNIIVMSDHLRRRGNLKAFTSVLAATLTTVGALGIVFFLDESIRLNLQDFVTVVIINLAVSLLTALFLVPALTERIGLGKLRPTGRRRLRPVVWFTRAYRSMICFNSRHKALLCVALVLAFGLPVFMLPAKLEGEGRWAKLYNSTIGTPTYQKKIKPWVDKCLGGTLRLFVDDVYSGSYFNREDSEPRLSVYATLPNGATLAQMNELVARMESYLTEFPEIRQFTTSIYSPYRAYLEIRFTKEAQHTYFPYKLKSDIISKAQTLGGGSWSVYGLENNGFNNDVRETSGSYRVKMLGYNYDELEQWADTLRATLLEHRRIKEVNVSSEFQWYKEDYSEYFLDIDPTRLAKEGVTLSDLFTALRPIFGSESYAAYIPTANGREGITLRSRQGTAYDVWSLMNMPLTVGKKAVKLADFATISRRDTPKSIAKENQQYRLCVQFDYIGSSTQASKILKADLESMEQKLPLGYSAKTEDWMSRWGSEQSAGYWLLALVIVVIFFTSSVLFNSLSQPLAIVFTIPISFIGVFLMFFITKVNFDQGGFASFILLCGITVNASIYLLNEYNAQRRRHPGLPGIALYLRAWNMKIFPIFLTVVSTILGFIPFMIGQGKESFWFPMALGTIGGLLMSLLGIFIFLPIFTLPRQPKAAERRRGGKAEAKAHQLP